MLGHDPFKDFDKTPDVNDRSYSAIIQEQLLNKERDELLKKQ